MAEQEYIERKAAIAAALSATSLGNSAFRDVYDTVRLLCSIHAADVRPVVRGKWLNGNDNPRSYGRIRAMCGRCGAFALAEPTQKLPALMAAD